MGKTWIRWLGYFSQPLNLFLSKGYLVDMGYMDLRQVRKIKSSIHELLVLLQETGGEDAILFFRRWEFYNCIRQIA